MNLVRRISYLLTLIILIVSLSIITYAKPYNGDSNDNILFERYNVESEDYLTVIYKDYDNYVLVYQEVERGQSAIFYEPLHKEGYTFIGWYKNSNYTEAWNFNSEKIYEDTSLYGKWIKNKEPVVFVWGESINYRNGNVYNSNDDLIFKIYSQNSFITIEEFTQLLNFSTTTVSENITIQFEPNVTVVYPSNVSITNYGNIRVANEIYLNATTLNFGTLQLGKMVLGGYLYNYGNINMFGDLSIQTNGKISFLNGYLNFIDEPVWAKMYFTVVYRNWDGSIMKTENVIENHTANPPLHTLREGFTFVGWDVPLDKIIVETIATAEYKQNISGTVEINGIALYNKELTADIYGITPSNATLSYQWNRNGVAITGATGLEYAVTQADIGQNITVTVTGSGDYIGEITSDAVNPNKADGPISPITPTIQFKSSTRVFLQPVEGYEYRIGYGEWQKSNEFISLSSVTTYEFYQRIAETSTHMASIASKKLEITTEEYLLGDINDDIKITTVDALMALQAASGRIELSEQQKVAADVNKDGRVTTVDALMILKYASGRISEFE